MYFWKSNLYSRFLIFAFWYLLSICIFKNSIFSTHFYLWARLLAWLLSPPLDSPYSPPGRLYLLLPPSLLYPTLWISLCVSDTGEHLGNWLLAGSVTLLLIPPLYPPGHLCLLPPSSILCVTPWTSLRDPDCGEHIGKQLLASLLSPLLIPPLLLLVTPISLFPLLFSMLLCVPLLVSLNLEKLFIFNLDILSLVLYRCISLEATVRIRLKTRVRRLKSKSWEHQRNPESREH